MTDRTPLQSELLLYAAPAPESGPAIELDGRRIAYMLQRTRRRRTISLLIDERGRAAARTAAGHRCAAAGTRVLGGAQGRRLAAEAPAGAPLDGRRTHHA